MLKKNRWRLGKRQFVMPPLPAELQGVAGCSLRTCVLDPEVGEEVFALFREEPGYAETYARVSPLTMLATTGVARTPDGVVGFIVWQIAVGTPYETAVEQYINPNEIDGIRLVSSAANQTHFKLVVIDCMSGEVTVFIDFENNFGFDEFASGMAMAIGHEPVGDFHSATRFVRDRMSVPDLLNLGAEN